MKQKRHHKSQVVAAGLLDYLKESGQEDLLSAVTQDLQDTVGNEKTIEEIVVESPIPMQSEQLRMLQNILKDKFNIEFPIVNKINKDLIGGFTIQAGDWFLDASLLHELKQIKHILLS